MHEKRLHLSICRISMTADSMIFQVRAECAWACVHALRKNRQNSDRYSFGNDMELRHILDLCNELVRRTCEDTTQPQTGRCSGRMTTVSLCEKCIHI